jgi:hypothetical protein
LERKERKGTTLSSPSQPDLSSVHLAGQTATGQRSIDLWAPADKPGMPTAPNQRQQLITGPQLLNRSTRMVMERPHAPMHSSLYALCALCATPHLFSGRTAHMRRSALHLAWSHVESCTHVKRTDVSSRSVACPTPRLGPPHSRDGLTQCTSKLPTPRPTRAPSASFHMASR